MNTTTAFTTVVTSSSRNATLRSVFFVLPHVAPPGVDWTPGHGGRHFDLTSFKGGPVEVYVRNAEGIYMFQGSVRDYAPGADLQAIFKAVWTKEQPSAAALKSFEDSAAIRA